MGFPERFHSFSPPPQVQRSPFKALLPGPAGAGHLDQARQQQEFLWQRISPRMTRNERCRFNSSCAFSGHGLQEGGTGPSPVRPGRRGEAPVSEAVPGRLKGDERDLLHSPGWPGHAARLWAAQPRGRRPLTSPQRRRPLHSPSARRRPLHPPPSARRHHHHLLGPAPLRREGCRAPSPSPVSPSRLPSPVLTTGPASRASSQLSRRAPAGRRRRTPRRRRAAAAVAAAIDHATATAARTPYGHGRGRLPAPGAAGLPAVGGAGRYGTVQHGTVRRGQGLLPAEG